MLTLQSVITSNIVDQRPAYPYLGIWGNGDGYRIVLFNEHNTGMQVNGGGVYAQFTGMISKSWSEDEFKPYTGEVTLSNKVE